jgi:hypothetical protein
MINRRSGIPSLWALLFLGGCCALSLVITFSAGAQDAGTAQPATTAPAPEAPATSKRPPPSKAEESASIEDDPTLVPDDKESADNNVTFPIDI